MSSSGPSRATPAAPAAAADVIAFLRENPAFLDHHPDLLGQLAIPHESGEAVSLLERQVAVLRADNQRLKQQLDELVAHARANEALNVRIHALALKLMNAAGPQAVFGLLDGSLRAEFGADRSATLVFADPGYVDAASVPQFVGADAPARAVFEQLLSQGRTACGPLDDAAHTALFGDAPRGSAVVMPLAGAGWDGVLAIASDDAARYDAAMGTEFLTYLKDVTALVIDPWVKRAHPRG
ncbi:MAG: DUF484 family protein [Gammaproteobacteria bacterium]